MQKIIIGKTIIQSSGALPERAPLGYSIMAFDENGKSFRLDSDGKTTAIESKFRLPTNIGENGNILSLNDQLNGESELTSILTDTHSIKSISYDERTLYTSDGFEILDYSQKAEPLTNTLTTVSTSSPSIENYNYTNSITNTTPYGFSSSDDVNTLLLVIANMQTRLNEMEDRLQKYKLL